MTLGELLTAAGVSVEARSGDIELSNITPDSRQASPGSLFVCVPSTTGDSHRFVSSAIERGAVAALAHSVEGYVAAVSAGAVAAWIDASDFDEAMWRLARAYYASPTRTMRLVGVVGTNGKTTTAWILRQMLGDSAAYMGTLGFSYRGHDEPLPNTTPFALDVNRMLAEARDAGVEAAAIEVSSHALDQKRADGLEFDCGLFTNFTQDHLDYHGTLEAYEAAKLRMFTELPQQTAKKFVSVLNVDDPVGARWAGLLKGNTLTYGLAGGDLTAEPLEVGVDRLVLRFLFGGRSAVGEARLGGTFNVWNCLAAVAVCLALGSSLNEAVGRLREVRAVPGRFEPVPNDAGLSILVDYAHTPDAMEKLLDSVKAVASGKVTVVFGCGGDRDRTKRPLMAKAASERADLTVVTSDNPRTEDPQTIVDEVLPGVVPGRTATAILDRADAIRHAILHASPGDVVVVAGKGHENYQIIGRDKFPFDDRDAIRSALAVRP